MEDLDDYTTENEEIMDIQSILNRRKAVFDVEESNGYFAEPNTTPVPNSFFDLIMTILDEDELRVMLYLFRHTFGYKEKKTGDFIAMSQFTSGNKIDKGCGIVAETTKATEHRIYRALERLIKTGLVIVYKGLKANLTDRYSTNKYKLNVKKMQEVKSQLDGVM